MTNVTKFSLGFNADKEDLSFQMGMACRHGLIAGATGTGKTVTLQTLAEEFSLAGVPVFLADVKGDLAGLCQEGSEQMRSKISPRLAELGISDWTPKAFPAVFWDLMAKQGFPILVSLRDFGPKLLARYFELSDAQSGVLELVFKVAGDRGLKLDTLSDLSQLLISLADEAQQLQVSYGNVSKASLGAIQRTILSLSEEIGGSFFGPSQFRLKIF